MRQTRTMTEALVRTRYVVPELWIGKDALDFSFTLKRDGHHVVVRLPNTPDALSAIHEDLADQWLPSLVPGGPVFEEAGRDSWTAGLILFEVLVELATEIPSPKPSELTPEIRAIAERDLKIGSKICDSVANLFLRHVRATAPRQSWLGLATHEAEQYGIASLENRHTGEFIFGMGAGISVTMRSSRLRLDRGQFFQIAKAVAEQTEPGVAESLLADAWHLNDATGANDRDRAWIVAAVACEVRVKRELRNRAVPENTELVEMVLRRRSNLPELLDEVWTATGGTSLRHADKELFTHVTTLAAQRNRIVHVGAPHPTLSSHLNPAQIAQFLFDWLDQQNL